MRDPMRDDARFLSFDDQFTIDGLNELDKMTTPPYASRDATEDLESGFGPYTANGLPPEDSPAEPASSEETEEDPGREDRALRNEAGSHDGPERPARF